MIFPEALATTEPFSSLGLAGLRDVDGFGELVPPGNSIVSLTCLFACTASAVMVG